MNFINTDKLIKQCEANIALYQKTIDAELAHLSEARDMYSLIRAYAKKEAEEDVILRIKMELNQFSVDTSNQNQNKNISIEQILKNMNKIEDILIHSFGGYPYSEEELTLLVSLNEIVESFKKQTENKVQIKTNIYNAEEIYPNCTVQILTNTLTGEISTGWWKND